MGMEPTIYDLIGGADTIGRLVDVFYRRIQAHPELSKMFPEDIMPVRNKQYRFLTQLFGGPHLYSEVYGSPMMRARHLPHPITPARAEDWLQCMSVALDEVGIQGPVRSYMVERLSMTAHHMVNTEEGEELETEGTKTKKNGLQLD
jgi:hemoglobin